MSEVVLGFLLSFASLFLLGFWLAWAMLRGPRRAATALACAPAAGLVFLTLAGTALVSANLPVAAWSWWLLGASAVATAITVIRMRQASRLTDLARDGVPGVCALIVVSILAISPIAAGGLTYSIYRGNGTDAANYLVMAKSLDRTPIGAMRSADLQTAVEMPPSGLVAKALLQTRWATPMVLAVASRIANVPSYRFDLAFSSLCFVVAFGPIWVWCRQGIGLRRLHSALIGIAVTTGFWAQLVIDLRAEAHHHALPIAMLAGVLVIRLADMTAQPKWREALLLGLVLAALLAVYPEIVPTILAGIAGYLVWSAIKGWGTARHWTDWALAAASMVLFSLPQRELIAGHLALQVSVLNKGVLTWHSAYFSWLEGAPLSGAWGLRPLLGSGDAILHDLVRLLAAALTATFLMGFFRVLAAANGRRGLLLSMMIAAAALAEWGVFALSGQWWAAGKALSYGAPFITLATAGFALSDFAVGTQRWRRLFARISVWVVIAFLGVQASLAASRPLLAAQQRDWSPYLVNHGDYRRHDWNLTPIVRALGPYAGREVWTSIANPWVAEYVDHVLGEIVTLTPLRPGRDQLDMKGPAPRLRTRPEFLLSDQPAALDNPYFVGVEARTPLLALVRIKDQLTLEGIDNPNGRDGTSANFLWLGGAATVVRIVAVSAGCGEIAGNWRVGPSNPERREQQLIVSNDGANHTIAVGTGQEAIPIRLRPGMNELRLQVRDGPTVKLPNDARPLQLRVDRLTVAAANCRPDGVAATAPRQ